MQSDGGDDYDDDDNVRPWMKFSIRFVAEWIR
jgi:hypothetical protein